MAVETVAAKPRSTQPRVPWRTGEARLRYIAGFDGIRAIAVIAVLLFHADLAWLPGGFLGVDVFFVLSGFLITSILLKERETTGSIAFGRFYLGRARRLLPALLLVLATSALLALLFAQDAAATLRTDIIASLGYVSNWWYIFHDQSYFEAIGRPPMLAHLWSLAVEEQFYLVWPVVLLIAFRWRGRPGVRRAAIIGAIASTLLMATLALWWGMPGAVDPSRLYFGTDTHAMGVLLGAALATVWRPDKLPQRVKAPAPFLLFLVGAVALGVLVWFFHTLTQDSTFLYVGGFFVVAAVTAILIAVVSHPAVSLGRLLGMAPLRYIGTRSYGLYLWHWPIFVITRPGIDIGWTGMPALILRLGLTALVAEASFRWVEMPVRRGAISATWRRWRSEGPSFALGKLAITVAPATLTVVVLGFALSSIAAPSPADYLGGQTSLGAGELTPEPTPPPSPEPTPESTTAPPQALATVGGFAATPMTAIGDSVLLGASSTMKTVLKKLTVDAAISRQTSDVLSRVRARKTAGQLADTVIIHTGTNGPPQIKDLMDMLTLLQDRKRVVLINTRMPDKLMAESNQNLATVASRFPNARVADWANASAGRREYFAPDGTHTTPAGAKVFLAVVESALRAQ